MPTQCNQVPERLHPAQYKHETTLTPRELAFQTMQEIVRVIGPDPTVNKVILVDKILSAIIRTRQDTLAGLRLSLSKLLDAMYHEL